MDASTACTDAVSEDNEFQSFVNTQHYIPKEPYVKHKEVNQTSIVTRKDSSGMEEIGIAHDEKLHIRNARLQEFECVSTPDKDETCHTKDETNPELEIHQFSTMVTNPEKGLSRRSTFPCSGKMLYAVTVDGREKILGTALHSLSSLQSEIPVCSRSLSLPTSFKLVSSMKGSRELQGTTLKTKLNVKWAPDVYDPPATSLSHTVNNQQQRNRSKKKNHKQKHKGKEKGKSLRGSSYEKQMKCSRSIGNIGPLSSRFQALDDISPSDGFNQSIIPVLDLAVSSQDSKCGSSFFRTTLAKVNLSVAEATT